MTYGGLPDLNNLKSTIFCENRIYGFEQIILFLEMEPRTLDVLPIHKYPEFMKQCCDLINDEWPRSETARMLMLQASSDRLPTSLVLVSDRTTVLGHCKLTPIPSIPESCFLEAVVISKVLRGKKLGTFLMNKAEDYCRNVLNLKMMHLSTKGQDQFYAKLGYTVCAPISIYGVFAPHNLIDTDNRPKKSNSVPKPDEMSNVTRHPPPPPPPPMPKNNITTISVTPKSGSNKTYMLKNL